MKRVLMMLAALMMLWGIAVAEPEERAAAFAAEILPEYTFFDGVLMENTAMLLMEDMEGITYLAACERHGDEWAVTLSAPFTGWTAGGPDYYEAHEGSLCLYFAVPPEYRAYEDADWLDVYIDLLPDSTWRINLVNTGWDVIEFRRHSISLDVGYEFFGDISIPLDITQVDWAALPRSFHQAMELLDTTRWRLVAEDYTPVYTADGSIAWQGASGAAVQVVSAKDGMAEVGFLGREDTGWIAESSLIPGSEQAARYDIWCDDGNVYGTRDIILEDDDSPVTWYAVAHDDSTASPFVVEHVEYVSLQGWCADECCALVYSEALGTSGFVPVEQLPYLPE